MAHVKTMLAASVVLALAITTGAAMTVEEVIEKHIAAHGGREKAAAIETMQVTGTFQAFSEISPFTLTRKRDSMYHLDHKMNARPVVIGYDGEIAWWENGWMGPGAQIIQEPDLAVVLRDTDFLTPFFDYEARGYQTRLIGETEFEGMPVIGVELIRGDGGEEIWYLDPETYLEVARVSPGSDFGTAMPQRTFFDDFREVDGVLMPHLTETQWYTRDRVMMVENVKTNIAVDDKLFAMPAPPGMAAFQSMAGKWKVAWSARQQPGADWTESERTATIESLLGGALFRESYSTDSGIEVIRTLSFDQIRDVYRVTQITSDTRFMDIRVGSFGEDDGRLVVSNLETGTPDSRFGMTINSRFSIFDITKDHFETEHEVSIDGGESWFVAAKGTYTRDDS